MKLFYYLQRRDVILFVDIIDSLIFDCYNRCETNEADKILYAYVFKFSEFLWSRSLHGLT